MADPILTDFAKQTLCYPIPGLELENPALETEKSKSNKQDVTADPKIWVNSTGQTVKIFG